MREHESLFECIRGAFDRDPHEPFVKDAEAALSVIEKCVERLSDVHRRLILSVAPESDSFLYSQLFSEWHAATRDLRKLVEE